LLLVFFMWSSPLTWRILCHSASNHSTAAAALPAVNFNSSWQYSMIQAGMLPCTHPSFHTYTLKFDSCYELDWRQWQTLWLTMCGLGSCNPARWCERPLIHTLVSFGLVSEYVIIGSFAAQLFRSYVLVLVVDMFSFACFAPVRWLAWKIVSEMSYNVLIADVNLT